MYNWASLKVAASPYCTMTATFMQTPSFNRRICVICTVNSTHLIRVIIIVWNSSWSISFICTRQHATNRQFKLKPESQSPFNVFWMQFYAWMIKYPFQFPKCKRLCRLAISFFRSQTVSAGHVNTLDCCRIVLFSQVKTSPIPCIPIFM